MIPRNRLRLYPLLFLLGLIALAPLGGAGCAPGTSLFGPQINVADTPEKALADGAAKEKLADSAREARQDKEAMRLYNDAANYYAVVARKFAGTETGIVAQIEQGRVTEDDLKNDQNALNLYRNALRQYTPASFPARYQEAQERQDRLIARINTQNAKTIPYQALDALVRALGNQRHSYVAAIFIIALGITLIMWPLRARQYRSSKEMLRYQPELQKIQKKYKEDPLLMGEKIRAFQKEHGYNPMAGCLPALAQIPFTWGLFYTISLYQYQFSKATFLWVNPEAAAASLSWPAFLSGAVGHNLGEHDLILLLLYALSMFLQMKMTPPPPDPAQVEQQKIMATTMPTVFFFVMLQGRWASAFVLYWLVSNLFTIAQSWWINRSIPTPPPLVLSDDDDAEAGDSGGGSGSGGTRSKGLTVATGNAGAARAGAASAAASPRRKALSANPKLVSPKNRRKK